MGILYFFAFLAGIATVLSPCVLPVLPAILSAGLGKRSRPAVIVLGLVVSFAFFTLLLTSFTHFFGVSANVLRILAIVIIASFGFVLLFPFLSDWFTRASSSIGDVGSRLQRSYKSDLLLGAALGLVWTPCAGPILAAVVTLVATQSITLEAVLLILAYSLGAAIPLFLIAYGGSYALQAVPFLKKHSEGIRRLFGILMILTALGLYFNYEVYLQQVAVEYFPSVSLDDNPLVEEALDNLRPGGKLEADGQLAPPILGITDWINSPPLTLSQLKGKVVLIDFWTYSCINCIRTLPYIKSWNDRYRDQGLVIVGVHTPEFAFEKELSNVKMAVERFQITYPVALDNDYKTWQSYRNHYWPAHYLIDQQGVIRQVHFGEGKYQETENEIRALLGLGPLELKATEEKLHRPITPETYLGYERGESYQSDTLMSALKTKEYSFTPPLKEDYVGLTGPWKIEKQRILAEGDSSALDLNFIATKVYLVMQSEVPQAVTVYLDGEILPQKYHTDDMTPEGQILVNEARKYDVINLQGDYGRHQLSLKVPKGVSIYAFTFGDRE